MAICRASVPWVITDHTLKVCEHDITQKRSYYQIYQFEAAGDKDKDKLIRLLKSKGQRSRSRRDQKRVSHFFSYELLALANLDF